ncbi:putative permease [Escherichia coli]|uniref:Putative permease n=1 Tax=Escherichia coli TaxID=562 RepID=A0A376L1I3_ECOLX|nr:putative permease [Escherichia coli]
MPSSSHPVERFSFSTALFGMLVLTLGMGLGRFLYTPMLPVMMAEGAFSFSQLSWIASGNYAGYLAGSLLFSFGAFHQPSRLRPFLLVSALASGLLILAMAWLPPFILVLLIRFLAGVASAGMLIFGSTLIMQHTRHPFVLAALFSGVGIGIALGNEYVLAGLHFALSSQTLWQGAGALSGMMLIALTLLMPSKKHAIAPMPLAKTEQQIMSWWLLAILYGLAGFGYIIVADLPAAHGERCRLTIVNRPSLDVSRLINCARLLWLAMGSKTLGGFALPDGEFAGAGYQCAAYSRQRLSSLAYH